MPDQPDYPVLKKARTAGEIAAAFDTLTRFIEEAEAETRGGKTVALGPLDPAISTLCQAARGLPREEMTQVQPPMAGCIGALDRLAAALKDFEAGAV